MVVEGADRPGVTALARMAAEGLDKGEGIDPRQIEADYLREPDAVPRKPGASR